VKARRSRLSMVRATLREAPAEPNMGDEAPEPEDDCPTAPLSRPSLHEIVLTPGTEAEDPFVSAVFRRLGDNVRATFTPRQRIALERALFACRPLQNHPLDVRGVVPIFFVRFYYVLLAGRDRRRSTAAVEEDRRRKTGLVADAILIGFGVLQVLFAFAIIAYFLKSALGINLMPHSHAWELLAE